MSLENTLQSVTQPVIDISRLGDPEEFGKVFDLYSSDVWKLSLSLVANSIEADELVGTVFIKTWDNILRGNGPKENVRQYLLRVAHNAVRDSHKGIQIEEVSISEYSEVIANEGKSPHDLCEDNEKLELIQKELFTLSPQQREVISLRFYLGLSLLETAEIMGKKVNAISALQDRAIKTLRGKLEQSGLLSS